MRKLILKFRKFIKAEDGDIFVVTPFFALLFMMLCALVFSTGMWMSRKYELQIMADCMSRAGTNAIKRQYAVLETNGKYHVYTELEAGQAISYAEAVMEKFVEMNYPEGGSFEVGHTLYNPVAIPYEGEMKYAEWSSVTHSYHEKRMTPDVQYYNGNFSVYVDGTVRGIWADLLGVNNEVSVAAFSSAIAAGDAR